jgi:dimeric dUTPase (all-alpha-NTP-PPase superfamily)
MKLVELSKLFDLQYTLDHRIETEHHLQNEDLIDRKILALLVELGELANETRCFKFWSLKSPSASSVILEEFVDGIHFLLSLGLKFKFDKKVSISIPEQVCNHVDQFLVVYQDIIQFQQLRSFENYECILNHYFQLGTVLGFTFEQITTAYISKNGINHIRQDEGY